MHLIEYAYFSQGTTVDINIKKIYISFLLRNYIYINLRIYYHIIIIQMLGNIFKIIKI